MARLLAHSWGDVLTQTMSIIDDGILYFLLEHLRQTQNQSSRKEDIPCIDSDDGIELANLL